MARRAGSFGNWLVAVCVIGCAGPSDPPAGTGAEAVARDFYEALLRQDWVAAYSGLDLDTRARCDQRAFARLAQSHRRGLGFEPQAVQLRSCQEQGEKAIARAVFTGRAAGRQRFYKDAVTLRNSAEGWGVVLPPRFGRRP
jgi:hypothetical protein